MFDDFRSRPFPQKVAIIVALVISLSLVTAAQRDLHRRTAAEVRGDRRLWRILCLNALGALGYFRWGRRPPGATG